MGTRSLVVELTKLRPRDVRMCPEIQSNLVANSVKVYVLTLLSMPIPSDAPGDHTVVLATETILYRLKVECSWSCP